MSFLCSFKVKQLSAQWKESTNKVVDRKHQLETMLDECNNLEEKTLNSSIVLQN